MSTPSISYISQMLENPRSVTDAEMDQIVALKKAYPYFLPAYYMDAARLQQQQPFSAEVIDIMHATNGNWLLFHEFLEKVKKSDKSAPVQRVQPLQDINWIAPEEVEEEEPQQEEEIFAQSPVNDDFQLPEVLRRTTAPVVEPEATADDDIMAELLQKKGDDQPGAQSATNTESFSRNTDFFVEEPGMDTQEGLIYEDDFGHLVPVEEDIIPPFQQEEEVEEEQEETEEEVFVAEPAKEQELPGPTPEPVMEEVPPVAAEEEKEPEQPQPVAEHKHPEVEAPIIHAQAIYEQELPLQVPATNKHNEELDDALIKPIYTEDYFLHEGVEISNDLPAAEELVQEEDEEDERYKSLMIMMSFSEWLNHYKVKSKAQKEEDDDKRALKTMWQKEKLKAAMEEENDEIPEQVFEMAVNSITHDDGLASESMADIYMKQGKYDKAIDMYRKLSLRNPQKNTYFASKIEEVLKEKNS
ncbi:MAG: hypothetical protein EOP51_02480 [Sphingobacteriales bacterium]|nr:MAG: hypothetical protein EOP51_02480 [Sphingobacteriales bacterium]